MADYNSVMHGRWWDGRKMKEFSGDLLIEDGRIRLHANEMKLEEHIWDSTDHSIDVIFGETINGGAVTIFGCYIISAKQKPSGFTRYDFECEEVWFGIHIHDKNSAKCKAIYAEIPDLDVWLGKRPYSSSSKILNEISSDFSISFNLTEEYYREIIDNTEVRFIALNRPNFLSKNFDLSSTFTVKISPIEASSPHDLMEGINKYVILLSILYGRIIEPSSIHMEIIEGEKVTGVSSCPPFPNKKPGRDPRTIAFSFRETAENIPGMIGRIGEMLNKHRESFAILFLSGKSYALDSQDSIRREFLDLCHVVEGIVSELPSSKIISDIAFKEFKKNVEDLISNIDDDDFVKINKDRLGRWNEPVLKGKLKGFVFGFEERFTNGIGIAESDIEKIVATRNYYAHMASKKNRKVVGFPEMARYNRKILFMLYIHLLMCLGINENRAVLHVASTEQFRGVLDFDLYNS